VSESHSTAPPNGREDIEARAAEFLLRRRFWDWSDAAESELDAWLADSVAHRVTFLRLEAGAMRAERLAALRPPRVERPAPRDSGERWRFVRRYTAFAASTVLVLVLGFSVARYVLQPSVHAFATDVGGRALLKFADGTQMELNTDTAVRYSMTTAERLVWLDKGEAYFTVSHDSAHPFTVVANGHRITDLGTEFLVRSDTNDLEIALVKGRAQLRSEDHQARIATLTPGDDARATSTAIFIVKKTPQQLTDALAWQHGELVFHDTPLAEAVRQFNRYNRAKLILSDATVAGLKIGGAFKTDNVDDFLRLAQVVLKLHVQRVGNNYMLSSDGVKKAVGVKHRH